MASSPEKSPNQVALESRLKDLGTILSSLPKDSPLRVRKEKQKSEIEAELAAIAAK